MSDDPDGLRAAQLHGLQLFFELGNYHIPNALGSRWHRITPLKRNAWELRFGLLPLVILLSGFGVAEVGEALDSTPIWVLGCAIIFSIIPYVFYIDRYHQPRSVLTPASDGYYRAFETQRTILVEALLRGFREKGVQAQLIKEERGVEPHVGFELIALRPAGVELYIMAWSHHGTTVLHLGPLRYPLRPAVEEVRADIDRIADAAGIS